MKRILFTAMIIAFGLISCSDMEVDNAVSSKDNTLDTSLDLLKDYSSFITKNIYEKAYDKNDELIDYEKARDVMLSYEFYEKKIDLLPCFSITTSRSIKDINDEIKGYFSQAQFNILEKYLLKSNVTDEDIRAARQEASFLPISEKPIVVYILDATSSITTGIFQEISILNPTTRVNESVTFVCNLASGMVGAVTGFLAGCFCGPAAPVVGTIVSTVVGAYISTKAC